MGKIALLFAGQGAQYPGMGEEIAACSPAAKAVFVQLEALRPGLSELCFDSSKETLSVTENTQPCLFAADLAIAEAVRELGIEVDGVAGFSLGEIPALTFAGVLPLANGFQLVCQRAAVMHKAAEAHPGAMMAVLKLTAEQVIELCTAYSDVFPANFNSPGQVAVSGNPERLAELAQKIKQLGGRTVPLAVSGAFHTPYMDTAAQELSTYLEEVLIQPGSMPVYANLTAAPYEAEQAKAWMSQQVNHPVQWQKTIERMAADGFDSFIEVGPGKTLSGLVKKTAPHVQVYHVEYKNDLQQLTAALVQ